MENDILKEISGSQNRDIVIKMGSNLHWADHIRHIQKLKDEDLFYEISVSSIPKSNKGNRCYLSYKNKIYAWLEVYSITKKAKAVSIELFPYLNFVFPSLENGDFDEDFRYFYDNSLKQ